MNERLVGCVVLIALSVGPSISGAQDKSAWEQLQDATSGAQSTGETFDTSVHPLPSDAYPYGSVSIPEVQGSPVETSPETSCEYDVDTSTGSYDTGSDGTDASTDTTSGAYGEEATE